MFPVVGLKPESNLQHAAEGQTGCVGVSQHTRVGEPGWIKGQAGAFFFNRDGNTRSMFQCAQIGL